MSFSSAMELPKDLEKGTIVLTALGRQELHIENHKGLLEFEPDCIRVLCRKGRITIRGEGLWIRYYDREDIHVTGTIQEIEYS